MALTEDHILLYCLEEGALILRRDLLSASVILGVEKHELRRTQKLTRVWARGRGGRRNEWKNSPAEDSI